MSTIIGLYGILILFLIGIFTFLQIELQWLLIVSIIFLAVQFIIAPYITDFIMRVLYKARFDAKMPAYIDEFVAEVCKEHNMKYPKMGYIDDGNPNAFTYGRTKNDARIVVTRGLFDLLTPDEVKAVVAHEIGHAIHYDMFFMTVAQIVPLVLRWIYEITVRGRTNSDSNNGGSGKLAIFGIIAFILHIIAQYVILWFSRMRELYADEFAVKVTKNPNSMGNALVKIGYGLVTTDEVFEDLPIDKLIAEIIRLSQEKGQKLKEKNLKKLSLPELRIMLADLKKTPKPDISSVATLGIFDAKTAKNLALAKCGNESETEHDRIKRAARWDLWNPWAKWFELHSTHPRISKRVMAITRMSSDYQQKPFIEFDEAKNQSYALNFIAEILIMIFPLLIVLGAVGAYFVNNNPKDGYLMLIIGFALLLMGIVYFLKLRRGYPNHSYPLTKVANLLGEVNVSHITGISCSLKGRFIGRGSPGFIFSEDFILRDETGIVFIDYRQPLSIMNFFFALFKAQRYIDQDVTIKGWYKRGPIPFVELYEMEVNGEIKKCYSFGFKKILTGIFFIAGFILTFLGAMMFF